MDMSSPEVDSCDYVPPMLGAAVAPNKRKDTPTAEEEEYAKRHKEAKEDEDNEDYEEGPKEGRVSMMQQPGVPEYGTVLFTDEYGEWRSVPGFSEDKVRVSSEGWVQIYSNHHWEQVTRGNFRQIEQRHLINVNWNCYRVYHLICRSFHGPQPTNDHSVEHRNISSVDNRAENLYWATKTEQALNKNKPRLQSTAKPIYVQKQCETPQWFEAAERAANALGLDGGGLRSSAKVYKDRGKIRKIKGCYRAWWAPAPEPQYNLLAGDDCNLLIPPVQGGTAAFPETGPSKDNEVWVDVTDRLKLSNRGRVQTKNNVGDGWGYKHTPIASKGMPYPMTFVGGKQLLFRGGIGKYNGTKATLHILVWMAFGENGGVIPSGMTIDHKASDRKFDSRICNLRVATRSEQALNQIRKSREDRQSSRKIPVWGKPRNSPDAVWEFFQGMTEAAHILNTRNPKAQKFLSGPISMVVRGICVHHNGWVFKRA